MIVFIWTGVAFMVAFLFLLMVALEKLWERTEAYYQEHCGKPQEQVHCILERTEAYYQAHYGTPQEQVQYTIWH